MHPLRDVEERWRDEDEGAGAVMMPSLPLVRTKLEDKVTDLDRFVRAEYREGCAGWLASGLEPEAGMGLPCANLPSGEPAKIPGAERTRRCDCCCPSAEPTPHRN